jgi:hypothetical protein
VEKIEILNVKIGGKYVKVGGTNVKHSYCDCYRGVFAKMYGFKQQ